MVFAVTLMCLIASVWTTCAPRAVHDVVASTGWPPTVIGPFVLCTTKNNNITVQRDFYLWCFGSVIHLPWHAEVPTPNPTILTVQPRIILEPPLFADEEPLRLDSHH